MSRSFKKLCHNRYIKAISGKRDFINRFRLKDLEENYPIEKINRIKSKKDKDLLASFCVDCCYNKGNISKILYRILSNKIDLNDSDYFKNRNQINLLTKQLKEQSGAGEDLLYEKVVDIEYDIKFLKNNSPYLDNWESFYNYPKEKPKSKYELCKDLRNLSFMELKYLYSYGVGNYCITSYGNWYENEGNVIHDDNKFYYRNLLVMDNFYGKKTMYIDIKKYNTVKKVLDYLLTQGYGVLLPSLIPRGYSNYYYFYLKLLEDGSLINHHESVNEKRVFDSYNNFLNVIKLLLENHKFTTENINGFIFDDLHILEDQVYWYYKLYKFS